MILYFANIIVISLIMIFSFLLLIKGEMFQPANSETRLGKVLSWAARTSLGIIIIVSFRYLLDFWLQIPHTLHAELFFGVAFCVILGKLVQRSFREPSKSFKPSKIAFHSGYLTLLLATFTFFLAGPVIERKFFPVMTEIKQTNIVRQDDLVCWDLSYFKERSATLNSVLYEIVSPEDGKHYDVQMYRKSNGIVIPFSIMNRTEPGEYNSQLCVSIPDKLKNKNLYLYGEAKYTVMSPWTYYQLFPPLTIPPIGLHNEVK